MDLESEALSDLCGLPSEPPEMRDMCDQCE